MLHVQHFEMRMQVEDKFLVEAARSGDAEAFGTLVARHYDLIFRVAFKMLGARAEAEDLAQDVCAALPAKLKGFRSEARFTTWLYRVVLNAAHDQFRKRQTKKRLNEGWGEVEALRRDENAETQGELDWLQTAMTRLAPDLRATLALVLGEDMTHGAAAEALGLSEGTVSWRMSEVKKALRQMAKEEEMLG